MGSYASNLQSLQQLQQEALQEALPIYQQNAAGGSATATSSANRANTITGLLGAGGGGVTPNQITSPGASTALPTDSIDWGSIASNAAGVISGLNGGPIGSIAGVVSNATAGTSGGSFWKIPADAVFILIGIVFIGVGLFMFKQTQSIIEVGGRAAAGAARVAAA